MFLSNKFVLLFAISCVILSMCSQSVEGQLPGIRWGRNLQGDELVHKEYSGKLWELMKRRYTKHHENSKLKQDLSYLC